MYKTLITDLDLSTTLLANGCSNDDVIRLGPLHSQLLFQCVQISYAYFEHILLQYFSHSGFKSGELDATVNVEEMLEFLSLTTQW